jgi:hypothetical protein
MNTISTDLHAIGVTCLKAFIFGERLSWEAFLELRLQIGRAWVAVVPGSKLALCSHIEGIAVGKERDCKLLVQISV